MADTQPDAVLVTPKPFWQSKTVIANALLVLLFIADAIKQGSLIPTQYLPWVAVAVGVLNLVLRMLTESPLTMTKTTPPDPPYER